MHKNDLNFVKVNCETCLINKFEIFPASKNNNNINYQILFFFFYDVSHFSFVSLLFLIPEVVELESKGRQLSD